MFPPTPLLPQRAPALAWASPPCFPHLLLDPQMYDTLGMKTPGSAAPRGVGRIDNGRRENKGQRRELDTLPTRKGLGSVSVGVLSSSANRNRLTDAAVTGTRMRFLCRREFSFLGRDIPFCLCRGGFERSYHLKRTRAAEFMSVVPGVIDAPTYLNAFAPPCQSLPRPNSTLIRTLR